MKKTYAQVEPQLRESVLRFYQDYALVVDTQDLESWPDFFTDDCKYVVTARENYDAGLTHGTIYCEGIGMIRDRAAGTRDCTVYEPRYTRHFIDNLRIFKVDGDIIQSSAYLLVIESLVDQAPQILVVGEYIDTLQIVPTGLKIKQRFCVFDNTRIPNTLVFPV